MKTKNPASGKRTGLDFDTCKSDSSKKHTRLPIGVNRRTVLKQIADRCATRGLYTPPNRAMEALLGDVL